MAFLLPNACRPVPATRSHAAAHGGSPAEGSVLVDDTARLLTAPDRRHVLARPTPRHRKPSRNVIYATVGTVAAASVAATVIAAGPALFSPAHHGAHPVGASADLALALSRVAQPGQPATTARPHGPQNPGLIAKHALSEQYYIAVRAERRAAARRAAARRAAELAAARRRQAAAAAAQRRRAAAQRRRAAQAAPSTPSGSPQQIAMAMLPSFGWSSSEFSCLNSLWQQESGWNTYASNPTSGAYGIPQALPGSKMASAGPDWQTNPATQIKWGLGYIQASYGSPCSAWSHETSYGWY